MAEAHANLDLSDRCHAGRAVGRPGRRRARLRCTVRLRRALLARRDRAEHDVVDASVGGRPRPIARGLHPRPRRDSTGARHQRARRHLGWTQCAVRSHARARLSVRAGPAERHAARGATSAPPLNARQLERLPTRLQTLHTTWPLPAARRPTRRLAVRVTSRSRWSRSANPLTRCKRSSGAGASLRTCATRPHAGLPRARGTPARS